MKKQLINLCLVLAWLPAILNAQNQNVWTTNSVNSEAVAEQHGWVPSSYLSFRYRRLSIPKNVPSQDGKAKYICGDELNKIQ